MPLSSEDIRASYNPLIASLDEGAYKDRQASDANINFDKRVARAAYPITRMFDPSGKVNKAAIANATPYEDASQMWEQLSADMPQGRGMDSVVFQQKHQAGKQIYDMNLANQLNMMRESGMSEKKIKAQFDGNPELRQYMYENGMMELPRKELSFGKAALIGAGGYGMVRASQLAAPAYASKQTQSSLRNIGLEYSKKYKSVVPMSDKALTAKYVEEGMSKTEARIESKKVRDTLAKNKKSFWGKEALKPGGGLKKRVGTRAVLSNVAKTVGPKAGTGLLSWAGRAISMNPYGRAANILLLALPYIAGKIGSTNKVPKDESMWR